MTSTTSSAALQDEGNRLFHKIMDGDHPDNLGSAFASITGTPSAIHEWVGGAFCSDPVHVTVDFDPEPTCTFTFMQDRTNIMS